MKKSVLITLLLMAAVGLSAQEFNCKVQINTQQVQGFDRSVITNLKTAITEFMNNRKWTDCNFKPKSALNVPCCSRLASWFHRTNSKVLLIL